MMRQKGTITLTYEDTSREDGIWRAFPRVQVAESLAIFTVINIVGPAVPRDAPLRCYSTAEEQGVSSI